MEEEISTSYNKIKRVTNEELALMWTRYFEDHDNKELRDSLILQYIYLTKYVVGRVKVALPPTFSYEDISSYGVEGLIDAVEKFTPKMGARFVINGRNEARLKETLSKMEGEGHLRVLWKAHAAIVHREMVAFQKNSCNNYKKTLIK